MPTQTQSCNAATGFMYATGSTDPDNVVRSWSTLNATQTARLVDAVNLWDDVSNFSARHTVDSTDLARRSTTWKTDYFLGIPVKSYWENALPNDWTRVAVGDIAGASVLGINKSRGDNGRYHEVYIDSGTEGVGTFELGSVSNATLVHELGHSIIDDHISGTRTQSIMNDTLNTTSGLWQASTPMSLDIDKAIAMFGATTTTRTGDDVYGFNASFSGGYRAAFDFSVNKRPLVTIYDNGGYDALDASGFVNASGTPRTVQIDLDPGQTSTVDGSRPFAVIYKTTWIERAVGGAGNDTLSGNALANVLEGRDGQDTLEGRDGADVIYGGNQNDTLRGGFGYDSLYGQAGDDTLDGGNEGGMLAGGTGNDTYVNSAGGITIVEHAGQGRDRVLSDTTFYLQAHVEDLVLTGAMGIEGRGNTLANTITGNAGSNRIDGGAGIDTLMGGAGNDTYVTEGVTYKAVPISLVDRTKTILMPVYDRIVETAGGGYDTVESAGDIILSDHVERAILTGTGNTSATGSAQANLLVGNAGQNKLSGGGGDDVLDGGDAGDSMAGGAGNDTYYVKDAAFAYRAPSFGDTFVLSPLVWVAGDTVKENENEGLDHVISSISFTLSAHIENLTLTGAGNLHGWGNAGHNTIIGTSGDNKLVGYAGNDRLDGGLGRDILEGGTGDDTYVLGSTSLPPPSPWVLNFFSYDTVVETAEGGIDTIEVARDRWSFLADYTSYTLGAFIENGTVIGAGNFDLIGNASANVLTGNGGVNVLTGAEGADTLSGGLAKDTLVGGAGDDTYYLSDTTFEVTPDGESFNYVFDTVVEGADGGTDTMVFRATAQSSSFGLAANVENGRISIRSGGDLYGNDLANDLTGSSSGNRLDGGLGADTMRGGFGNDTYQVNEAGDRVVEAANAGQDIVWSRVSYTLSDNVESLVVLSLSNVSGTGNALDNVVAGSIGNNRLSGLDGNDTLRGWEGRDTLIGGADDDALFGGTDDDLLLGGLGRDTLEGEAGADTFDFNSLLESAVGANRDVVTFVQAEGDKIDLSTMDGDTDGTAGNQAFKWIGSGAFSGTDGQLRFSGGILSGDVNGDKKADFEIKIVGALQSGDVIL